LNERIAAGPSDQCAAVSPPVAARLKKPTQQGGGGALGDAAVDLRAVVSGRLGEYAGPVLDAATFRVERREIEPPDLREADRGGAHRAWLQAHVEVAAVEPLAAEPRRAGTQYQHLGMRGRVTVALDPIASGSDDRAGGIDERRADRYFAGGAGSFGLGQRARHRPIAVRNPLAHLVSAHHTPRTFMALPTTEPPQRIAKLIARAGLCSRRDAERWIAEGRVAVNGMVLTSAALSVGADSDIRVDGKPLPEPERARLWRYHKPSGLVTTHRDERGRGTVFAALPAELPRLVSVGRLDLNSEGLLLLTNDGALARRLELPASGWVRRYRVRVHGAAEPERLATLARGITIDGVAYGPIRAALDRQQGANAWLTLSLHEGKNREVRRVLDHLGFPVTRLIRVAYGPFQLGHLPRGAIEEVPQKVLREQLGSRPRE
jgi:23S rRNA pseudouridine2605 synthase